MNTSTQTTNGTPFVARLASWKVWVVSAVIFVPFAWMFFASSAPFAIPEVEAACGQQQPGLFLRRCVRAPPIRRGQALGEGRGAR